jgi:hypothetical protein
MSFLPCNYVPAPFPSNSSSVLDHLTSNRDWWSYRQLRALQTNYSEHQLFHRPFYRPAVSLSFEYPSPIQVGTEHYFEWRRYNDTSIIASVHIIIHPAFTLLGPHYKITRSSHQAYPTVHILWWDCPFHLPSEVSHFLTNDLLSIWPDDNLDQFDLLLHTFCDRYYRPVTPFSAPQNLYPHSPSSPDYIPLTTED